MQGRARHGQITLRKNWWEERKPHAINHGGIHKAVEKENGVEVAVPEKAKRPAQGQHNLRWHKETSVYGVFRGIHDMLRQDLNPKQSVNQSGVNHKHKESCHEQHPRVLNHFTHQFFSKLKEAEKDQGFGNAISDGKHNQG